MSSAQSPEDATIGRLDRIMAFTALALIAASLVAFLVIIAASAFGMSQAAFGEGAWPVIASVPMWGLPVGFALIFALLIISFMRKGRAAKRG